MSTTFFKVAAVVVVAIVALSGGTRNGMDVAIKDAPEEARVLALKPPDEMASLAEATPEIPGVIDVEVLPWVLRGDSSRATPTAEELADRRLDTIDVFAPPVDDVFVSSMVSPPPALVLQRSSWEPDCPVDTSELAYLQVSFFGFDGEFHTGELLVNANYGDEMVSIFERLHELRFPIEQMVIVSNDDFGVPANAYTNNTSVFECRRSVASGRWSRHAYGDAIDINPFHNPYVAGSRVIPTLAGAYADRDRVDPGLVTDEVVALFEDIGWGWGGGWERSKDWMHFSATGT